MKIFFFHGPQFSLEKELDEKIIPFLKSRFPKLGYTEPFSDSSEYLFRSGNFNIIHMSVRQYLENNHFIDENFFGELWLNGVIRYSREKNIDWVELIKELKSKNPNIKFVIGFNNLKLFHKLEKNLIIDA